MKVVSDDSQLAQLHVGNGNSGFVNSLVEGGANGEASRGRRAGDQIDDGLIAGQRTAAPVLGDEAEESMFDLVPMLVPGGK